MVLRLGFIESFVNPGNREARGTLGHLIKIYIYLVSFATARDPEAR
jgi:hypothetical protein